MKKNIIKSILVSLVLTAVMSAQAYAKNYDVVRDSNNNIVKNSFDNCVLTMWESDSDKCAPAAKAQQAPEVVPPAEQQARKPIKRAKSYLVFFDYNKSNLTPSALEIIKKANAEAHAGSDNAQFSLSGHTDASGTYDYNLKLSQKRAENVKGELVRLGNNLENIETIAKSKSQLLVPTKDGVKEPQNRRVEIMYYVEE